MPSAMRFDSLRGTVRNHPVVVATTAATVGVLMGGFVVMQLLATPHPRSDSAGVAPVAVEAKAVDTKPAPKPVAETTGSAPAGESVASADCDQQTWPHLSRDCVEEFRAKNRATRVITTDKLDKPTIAAIEAQPAAQPVAEPPKTAAAPTPASTPPSQPTPRASLATLATAPEAASPFAPPSSAAPLAVVAPAAAKAAEAPPQPAAKTEIREKRAVKKAKRVPKAAPKAPVRQETDDDKDDVAAVNADDRSSTARDGRPDRSRRIVDRWTERDYDVPDSRGEGRRRVTVIRRNNGGFFENLFGMGRGDDD